MNEQEEQGWISGTNSSLTHTHKRSYAQA